MGYYLFLPAILFRVATCYGLYFVIQHNSIRRPARWAFGATIAVLLVQAAANCWYVSASQISYSRAYTAAIREYVTLSHDGDSLIFESFPFYAEQVTGSDQIMRTVFHENRRVNGIGELVNPALITRAMRELLSVSDADLRANQNNWPKKNDYVIAFTGNMLGHWQIRGVSPFYSDGSDLQKDGGYDMDTLAEARQYFPAAYISVWTHWPDFRPTYAGYKIYRVVSGPRFTWLGKYPDGWIGKRAELTTFPQFVSRMSINVSTSKYNPDNIMTVFKDGVVVDRRLLLEGKEQTIELEAGHGDKPTVFAFEVTKTFTPTRLHLNNDARDLGVLIRFEPMGPTP